MFSKKFRAGTQDLCTLAHHVNAPYLRQKITLPAFNKAVLTVTGTGFYRLYVNGGHLTKGPLAPYVTNPDSVLIFDQYDLTAALKAGDNVLGFCLGNGLANGFGGFIWDFDKAIHRAAPAVAFALEVETADGQTLVFEADETMKAHPSPVTFDEIRCGIHYDARLALPGWSEPAYDDSLWMPSFAAETPRGEALLCAVPPLVISRTLCAKSIVPGKAMERRVRMQEHRVASLNASTQYRCPDHETGYLYDFGENVALIPTLHIHGEKGQVVALQFGEYCEGNELSWDNIERFYPRGYAQRDLFVCSGGDDEFTADFTFHGARYCLVTGITPEQATPDLLTAGVVHSDLASRGSFQCSDDVANRLQELVRRSDLANFQYFPLDCPHREKNGWTGDAAMSAEQMTLNFAAEAYFSQWLRLIRAAQRDDGAIPGIVPTTGWGFAWGNGPVWDQVMIELPYRIFQYRGDLGPFKENAGMILRYLHYISQKRDPRGLIDIGLGDWCQPGHDSGRPTCPTLVSDSITSVSICRKAALLFEKCDMKPQAVFAAALGEEFTAAVRKYLINFTTMTVESRCQCAQAMGLYYDIFTPAERPGAYRVLLDLVREAQDHFDCGMIGVRILFHVLAEGGDAVLAWHMITRTDYPSYGMFIKQGQTSLPELFSEHPEPSSLNHHFYGDISHFFISRIAGLSVNPLLENPLSVRITPASPEDLTFAEASYETVAGTVSVRWERTGEEITLTVRKPEKVTAEVSLPDGWHAKDRIAPPFIGRSFASDFAGTILCKKG